MSTVRSTANRSRSPSYEAATASCEARNEITRVSAPISRSAVPTNQLNDSGYSVIAWGVVAIARFSDG